MPEEVEFADAETSWQVFTMLEAFSDDFGGWRMMDVLGRPVVELPDALVVDLLTWKFLAGIIHRVQDAKKKDKTDG